MRNSYTSSRMSEIERTHKNLEQLELSYLFWGAAGRCDLVQNFGKVFAVSSKTNCTFSFSTSSYTIPMSKTNYICKNLLAVNHNDPSLATIQMLWTLGQINKVLSFQISEYDTSMKRDTFLLHTIMNKSHRHTVEQQWKIAIFRTGIVKNLCKLNLCIQRNSAILPLMICAPKILTGS